MNSLKHKTIHALLWSFFESAGIQGVKFVIGIVLARLLFPEQFGLIGMLTIFMAVSQCFLESGFGSALIQKGDATETDMCSIFYFNILVGLATAGLISLAAPWIADFYNQPILTPLARVLSLTIVINSFGLIQNTILIKAIDFKTQTKVSLFSGVLSGVLGIILAMAGFGVWSLAMQQIFNAILRTILLWLLNPWRPALIFSIRSLREMFGFGSRLLASGLLDQVFGNIYLLVIGRLFSAIDLGYFTRAQTFAYVPSQTLSGMVGRVTFPVFSTIQNDSVLLKRGMKKALTTLVLVNFPMMIGLAVVARPIVLGLLTEKWAASIPYLQLFCLLELLLPLHVINLNLLQAVGRSDLFLRLEVVKKVLTVINIAIAWRWGISAMIFGMLIMSIISYYLNSYYAGMLINYPISEQLRDLFPYLLMAVLMAVASFTVGLLPFPTRWLMLLAQIAVGVAVYGCLCRVFRLMAFMEVWEIMWNRMLLVRVGISK